MATPIFYSGTKNASSWAMRAWLALKAAEYPFEEVVVDIRRPQRFINLARIGNISPPACVPVLDTGRTVIFDSNAIMEFANDVSGGRLLPRDPETRAHARALVAWQHTGLSSICHRISFESAFYPFKRALSTEEQTECRRLLDCYEACLADSGGPFLFEDISLADFMHTPTVIRLYRHDVDLRNHPETRCWMETLLAYSWIADWIAEADRLPHIWFDNYLLPNASAASLISIDDNPDIDASPHVGIIDPLPNQNRALVRR
ncbi:glutathione S-transferase family protein [uncultured Nitratireductor sp.]|uniref:glutathione S-transferase family protein n=1 Tax=uncultured Nitratireductor sp. TaxID=520953 RepID=UPI0025CCEFEA|nr:glutathione S-transferase family protein [uncultured Nitratireductor sp.]